MYTLEELIDKSLKQKEVSKVIDSLRDLSLEKAPNILVVFYKPTINEHTGEIYQNVYTFTYNILQYNTFCNDYIVDPEEITVFDSIFDFKMPENENIKIVVSNVYLPNLQSDVKFVNMKPSIQNLVNLLLEALCQEKDQHTQTQKNGYQVLPLNTADISLQS